MTLIFLSRTACCNKEMFLKGKFEGANDEE